MDCRQELRKNCASIDNPLVDLCICIPGVSYLNTFLVCILSIDKKRKKHKEGGGDGGEDPNNEDDEEDSSDDEEENDMNALFGDDEMDEDKDEGEAQEVPFEDR